MFSLAKRAIMLVLFYGLQTAATISGGLYVMQEMDTSSKVLWVILFWMFNLRANLIIHQLFCMNLDIAI